MTVEVNDIDSLKALVDELKAKFGDKISVEALTLVVKIDGWDVKALAYENGYVYLL